MINLLWLAWLVRQRYRIALQPYLPLNRAAYLNKGFAVRHLIELKIESLSDVAIPFYCVDKKLCSEKEKNKRLHLLADRYVCRDSLTGLNSGLARQIWLATSTSSVCVSRSTVTYQGVKWLIAHQPYMVPLINATIYSTINHHFIIMSPIHTLRRSKRLRSARHKFARQNRGLEASTVKKSRVFYTFDTRGENPKLQICKELEVPKRTASYWLKQRALLGSPAIRRTRPRSQVIGGKSAIAHVDYSILLLPLNPVSRGSYITV